MVRGFLYVLLLIFLSIGFAYIYRTYKSTNSDTGIQEKTTDKLDCKRTSRWDNAPQYDRSLSLIEQRINKNQDGRFANNAMHQFNYFPAQLVNCIKIVPQPAKQLEGAEAYFTINSDEIRENYFPIIVDSAYVESDDIVIAFLLTHELTHVQQYIDSTNGNKSISCIDSEVEAFNAMYRFFVSVLNDEENAIVRIRFQNALDNYNDPKYRDLVSRFEKQLLMVGTVEEMKSGKLGDECKTYKHYIESAGVYMPTTDYYNCVYSKVNIELNRLLSEDPYYRKQCGLD
ncbi:hypothetical protein A3K01_03910 [candidate division WWE3 bacterium RIFOXYD1_FULL_43_17]|nr:MAG: hypothetical protein A3K01_03910 [candidate division WWE3 bacterium RIFOXYD1_FULL_43_17]